MNPELFSISALVRSETRRTGAPLFDEDLAQEASLRVVEAFRRKRLSLEDVRNPGAFLRKVVGDAVRDHWRRRRPIDDVLDAVDLAGATEVPAFEERLDLQRRIDLLRKALSDLGAVRRTTLDLYYVEELSVGEIAQRQTRSVSAVKMDLLRSRRMLAKLMGELENRRPAVV